MILNQLRSTYHNNQTQQNISSQQQPLKQYSINEILQRKSRYSKEMHTIIDNKQTKSKRAEFFQILFNLQVASCTGNTLLILEEFQKQKSSKNIINFSTKIHTNLNEKLQKNQKSKDQLKGLAKIMKSIDPSQKSMLNQHYFYFLKKNNQLNNLVDLWQINDMYIKQMQEMQNNILQFEEREKKSFYNFQSYLRNGQQFAEQDFRMFQLPQKDIENQKENKFYFGERYKDQKLFRMKYIRNQMNRYFTRRYQ